jgi:hypothetical protein
VTECDESDPSVVEAMLNNLGRRLRTCNDSLTARFGANIGTCRAITAKNSLMQRELKMKLITILLCVTIAAFAQTAESRKPVTDAEKITDASRAGPEFVIKDATLLDWPATPGAEYRVLRKGSSQWTCLPGLPGSPHDEPGCFDPVFLQFIKDSIAGRTPSVQSVGISYMYGGFWVPDKSHATGSGREFHVGPHIMIIGLDQKMLQTLNHDGSNGQAYVNHLAGHSELYLVIPIRQWDEK